MSSCVLILEWKVKSLSLSFLMLHFLLFWDQFGFHPLWIWCTNVSGSHSGLYAADARLPPWAVLSFSHFPSILSLLLNFLIIYCWCKPLKLLILLNRSSEDKLGRDWMRVHVNGERTSACDHDGRVSTHKSVFSKATIEVIRGFVPHCVCRLFFPSLRIMWEFTTHIINTYMFMYNA